MKVGMIMLLLGTVMFPSFAAGNKQIDGVYELISAETVIRKSGGVSVVPEEKQILSSPEWAGLWIIKDGYFSSVLMKQKRNVPFDCSREIGFESAAGTYEVKGNKIVFVENYSLNPLFKGRPVTMFYKIEGQIITLSQTILPTLEVNQEGTITIRLRKESQ